MACGPLPVVASPAPADRSVRGDRSADHLRRRARPRPPSSGWPVLARQSRRRRSGRLAAAPPRPGRRGRHGDRRGPAVLHGRARPGRAGLAGLADRRASRSSPAARSLVAVGVAAPARALAVGGGVAYLVGLGADRRSAAFLPLRATLGFRLPLGPARLRRRAGAGRRRAWRSRPPCSPAGRRSSRAWAALKPAHAWLNVFGFLSVVDRRHRSSTSRRPSPGARIRPRRSADVALVGLVAGAPLVALGFATASDPSRSGSARCVELVGAAALLVARRVRPARSRRLDHRPRLAPLRRPRACSPRPPGSSSPSRSPAAGSCGSGAVPAAWSVGAARRAPRRRLDRAGAGRLVDPPGAGDRAGRPGGPRASSGAGSAAARPPLAGLERRRRPRDGRALTGLRVGLRGRRRPRCSAVALVVPRSACSPRPSCVRSAACPGGGWRSQTMNATTKRRISDSP